MRKTFVRWLVAAVAGGLFMVQPALSAATGPGPLVDVAWLERNLGRDDLLLLDAQPGQAYSARHIPGAVSVDVLTFGGRERTAAEWEGLMRSWGVSAGRKVVIYDQGGTFFATSLFFDLYYHGLPAGNLAVLDGGIARWQAAGGAVTKEPTPAPKPGTFRAVAPREDVRVRLPEFLVASGDPARNALVEALEPAQHFGGARFFDRAGHVPNAVMTPSADFYNADKTFKSPEEIRRMLAFLGVTPDRRVYAHCGGGIAASVPFFAAKFLLDYPDVKLYKESQLEWLRDDRQLPFWTYDAPYLLRDKAWLSGWSNRMLRMYGVSRLAIVDVRPAASYRQAHLPFSVNVPAEEFRSRIADPGKLAALLGAAGIDASDEAVVVSGGGLDPDSALAFLLLERAGQRRVSILADSVDDWGFAGLPLDKEAGEAGAKNAAPNPAAAPRAYPVDIRPGVTTRGPAGEAAPYPTVYVASGRSLPARLPEGKVVHVPYADLLDAHGRPRPAMEIWNALAKAGVPRFAEIVTVSDDPGEAAADYFVLKMMGFPSVKVLER